MPEILLKLAWAVFSKLLTEKLLSRTLVVGLRAVAEKTTNKLDDEMVDAVAEALGLPTSKPSVVVK